MHIRFCLKALPVLVLVLALVVCLGGAAWADAPFPGAVPLALNVSTDVVIQNSGDTVYFSFTPSATMSYTFFSNGTTDTYGYLYDAEGNELASNDDSGSGRNFSISWTLDAGTTYYFGAKYLSSSLTGRFPVLLRVDNALTVSALTDTNPTVPWGGSVTMAVNASCNVGGLHYQWFLQTYPDESYTGVEEPVSGATTASFTVDRATISEDYFCLVTDDFGNSSRIYFYVNVDNGLTVSAVGETMVLAEPGEQVSFRVEASCDHGSLHYRWQHYTVEDLPDGPEYTVTASQDDYIYCTVSDDYGNARMVGFRLVVKTGFWAVPVADTYYKIYANIRVPGGEPAVLRVEAGSDVPPLSYSWCSENLGELEGSGPVYTTEPIYVYDKYFCMVRDSAGEATEVLFLVTPEEEVPAPLYLNTETPVSIMSEGIIRYFLFTPAETGDYLFFSADGSNTAAELYDDNGAITASDSGSGPDGNFMLRLNLTAGHAYRLGVHYADNSTGRFRVFMVPERELSVAADKESPVVKPLENVTMTVNVSGGTPLKSYQWYIEEYDDTLYQYVRTPIDGATAPSYTWRADREAPGFVCEVTDAYYGSDSVTFYPYLENHLRFKPMQSPPRFVPLGETIELRVDASCDVGSISYRWHTENDYDTTLSTANVLTTAPVTGQTTYICEVSDEFGDRHSTWFRVYVENELTVTPSGEVRVPVAPGGSAVMEVSASCRQGSIRYRWTDNRWNDIKTDTGASSVCTVPDVRTAAYYRCYVTDVYGTQIVVPFYVYVDNGFTAVAKGAASAEGSKIITVPYGGTAELEVTASCNSGSLHYSWNGPDVEEDTDTAVLTVENVVRYGTYFCSVSDDYGNMAYLTFEVQVDNAFSAQAVGKNVFCARRGDTVTLSVDASCRDGSVSYSWIDFVGIHGDMNFIPIEGANGSTITVPVNARLQSYLCIVSDKYGNSKHINFAVLDPDISLPEGLQRIESEAFAGMRELVVWVPPSVTEIAPDAFDSSTYVMGEPGTCGAAYSETRSVDLSPFLQETE